MALAAAVLESLWIGTSVAIAPEAMGLMTVQSAAGSAPAALVADADADMDADAGGADEEPAEGELELLQPASSEPVNASTLSTLKAGIARYRIELPPH